METNSTQTTNKTTKISIIKIALLSLFLLGFTYSYSQSNSCNATLKVEKDRNIQSSSSTAGSYYVMILTNNSSFSENFSLNTFNVNSTCSNNDGTNTSSNVNLETSFFDINQQPISQIIISSGQSVNFLVKVSVPIGTDFDKWCCTQIIAESSNCPNYKVTTVVHTQVINPNEG
ncbi:hypothetical protein [Flavobacterium frigoris]|uniref:Fn3-like domain-containing protein n=1 Tax=Flavobacterium frigoris TaxID=229204 RepID=A0A1H9L5B5_FLAFI|nr:hypothetical protein [Flavobacterium frigoris]SER06203.1 hypothetical protein SAMN05444355_106188 [Flavobacterium frigoris]